jgi:hypothetical protein
MNELIEAYPQASLVFLQRNPVNVLSSFKFIKSNSQDGRAGRYHPLIYARYWRSAVDAYLANVKNMAIE